MKMLHEIAKCVKENKADVGFGFDGDGDRVGVVDNEGNEIFADKIGLLIARNISNNHPGSKFIVDVKSTGLFQKDEVLLNNKCKTVYWKTGHSYIKRKVNQDKAIAGFEKSGHFFSINHWGMDLMMELILQFKFVIFWIVKIKILMN